MENTIHPLHVSESTQEYIQDAADGGDKERRALLNYAFDEGLARDDLLAVGDYLLDEAHKPSLKMIAGGLFRMGGMPEKEREILADLISNGYAPAMYFLGNIHYQRGEFGEALPLYEKAMRLGLKIAGRNYFEILMNDCRFPLRLYYRARRFWCHYLALIEKQENNARDFIETWGP